MEPAISIIVPIYNMEQLMRRCIDSLLAQTFRDFELLLVDDGSGDGSPAICDKYAQQDSRIRVFHKPNGGLSDARNFGLAHASGKYTIFADPDDWVSPEGLDKLYKKAEEEQADMTICDLYREDKFSRHYMSQRPSALDHSTVQKELFYRLGGFTVNKLIRRDVYERYHIVYPKGIYGCEDDYAMAKILMHNIKIAYLPVAYYHYMYNANSLSRHYDENTYKMDCKILKMFSDLLQGTAAYPYAVKDKTNVIFTHAFWCGSDCFSSKSFKKTFAGYKKRISALPESNIVKMAMKAAVRGYYQEAHAFVYSLFLIKQQVKKTLNNLHK